MDGRFRLGGLASLVAAVGVPLGAIGQETVPPPPSPEQQQSALADPAAASAAQGELQVLEEGPVHEAFAEAVTMATEPLVVPQEPPPPVDEVPPEFRPEGDNVLWIPGYWMWLEERNDFVWVSGLWRAVPPGRIWTPGHWAEEAEGYRWVPGFWGDGDRQQVEYLPYPPESLDEGPSGPAPADNYFWVRGCWLWESNRYAWRPGYWYPGQSNWVWVPHHYVHTPRGAVLVHGYWDYPVARRGLLYAPVYWQGGYRTVAGYRYTPNRLVNTSLLLSSLYINRNHGWYYFGPSYAGRSNFYPWYTGYRRGFYSPLYSYYAWQFGRDVNRWHNRFDDWDDWDVRRRGNRDDDRRRNQRKLVGTWDEVRHDWDNDRRDRGERGPQNVRRLTGDQRREALERTEQFERFRESRREFESRDRGEGPRQLSFDRRGGGERDGNRDRGRVRAPEGFQPPRLDLQQAAGADALRRDFERRATVRQRQEVMRQNLDQGRRRGPEGPQQRFAPPNRGNFERGIPAQRSPRRLESTPQRGSRSIQGPDVQRQRIERRGGPPSRGEIQSRGNRGSRGEARSFSRGGGGNRGPANVRGGGDRGRGNARGGGGGPGRGGGGGRGGGRGR